MNENKAWYKSKGVLGSVVAMVAMVLGMFGFTVGAEDQAALVEVALQSIAIVGAVMALVGRITATKGVGK